jgi:hypothetical protein
MAISNADTARQLEARRLASEALANVANRLRGVFVKTALSPAEPAGLRYR